MGQWRIQVVLFKYSKESLPFLCAVSLTLHFFVICFFIDADSKFSVVLSFHLLILCHCFSLDFIFNLNKTFP